MNEVRQAEVYLAAKWSTQLEERINRERASIDYFSARAEKSAAWASLLVSHEHKLKVTQALHELVARGVDPTQPRRFRGRVTTHLRCRSGGHLLGLIYPTAAFPIFVPSAGGLPLGKYGDKALRTEARALAKREEAALARAMEVIEGVPAEIARAISNSRTTRDSWIEENEDGVLIYGLEVLDPSGGLLSPHRQLHLWCRCGQKTLPSAALFAGDQVILV